MLFCRQRSQYFQSLSTAVAQWSRWAIFGAATQGSSPHADCILAISGLNLAEAVSVFGEQVTISQLKRVRNTVQTGLLQCLPTHHEYVLLSRWKDRCGFSSCLDRNENSVGSSRSRSSTQPDSSKKQEAIGNLDAHTSKTKSKMRLMFMQKCQGTL